MISVIAIWISVWIIYFPTQITKKYSTAMWYLPPLTGCLYVTLKRICSAPVRAHFTNGKTYRPIKFPLWSLQMSTVFLLQIWTLSRGGASKYERINAASWGIFQPSTLPPDSVVRGERSGGSRQTRLSHPRARDRKGRRPSSQVPTIVL